jgi:uncharacterized membrane protein YdfJ with MMPL/SSD domain
LTQKDFLLGVDGYSLLLERGFPLAAASAYLSNKSRSTILPIKYRAGYGVASIFSDFLQLQLAALWPENATTAQLGIELMGNAAFMDAIQGAVGRDMGTGDGVVLPIAFALLALMVRSARVLLLAVLSLVVSALVALGSMFGVTFAIDVMSATMSLMMSLAIALSIDYGLFLSVTFRESLRGGADTREALADALSSAGHTILVSGVTLIIACVGLLIIPMDAVGALGVGCAVAVASVLASNLTLVPAVMLSCPDFFRGVVDRVVRDETTLLLVNDTPTREKRRALCACCPSWERFAERLVDTKVSVLVVLLIVAVTAPFAYPAVTFATSQSVIMALPRGAPVTDAFLEMSREFGYGLLNTYDLLVHASANESVLTESFFEKSASAMRLLAECRTRRSTASAASRWPAAPTFRSS